MPDFAEIYGDLKDKLAEATDQMYAEAYDQAAHALQDAMVHPYYSKFGYRKGLASFKGPNYFEGPYFRDDDTTIMFNNNGDYPPRDIQKIWEQIFEGEPVRISVGEPRKSNGRDITVDDDRCITLELPKATTLKEHAKNILLLTSAARRVELVAANFDDKPLDEVRANAVLKQYEAEHKAGVAAIRNK